MSMTTEQISNYLKPVKTEENPQSEVNDNPVTEAVDESLTKENDKIPAEPVEEQVEPQTEKKAADKSEFAFKKLKNKEKAKRQKLISDYDAKIKSLQQELETYKNKSEKTVSDEVDERLNAYQLSQLNAAKEQAEQEDFEILNNERIEFCFPNENDRDRYRQLVDNGGVKLVKTLEARDPENAILSYLDDCDVAPLLIQVLMTKPEIRNNILSKRSPYNKVLAMENLANRLLQAKKIVDGKAKVTEKKNKLPNIGKVTTADKSPSLPDKSNPSYWEAKLKQLNSLRY